MRAPPVADRRFALFDGEVFHRHLHRAASRLSFAGLKIPFAPVATDVFTLEPALLTKADLLSLAVLASCSVPGLHPPVSIDGRWFVDGGVVCPVPASQVRRLGADVVLAVDLDMARLRSWKPLARVVARRLRQSPHGRDADWTFRPLAGAPKVRSYARAGEYRAHGRRAVEAAAQPLRELLPWLEARISLWLVTSRPNTRSSSCRRRSLRASKRPGRRTRERT